MISSYVTCRAVARLVAIGLLSTIFPASFVSADTLRSVVSEALETNPELAAIRFNRDAIDHELRAARGLGLPTIDVRANYGRHRDSLKTPLGVETTDSMHRHRDVEAILSQRLFDGFERTHEVARQKNRVESARWRVADTANSIALKAVQAYFEVMRSEAVLHAARRNLSSLQGLLARVNYRVDAGHSDAAEQTEAGSRVASARAIVAEALVRHGDAKALFRAVVGRGPGQLNGAAVPRGAMPRSVAAAVAIAREAAPSVIATQHDAIAAEAAVGTAHSRLYPKLNAELATYHGKGIDQRNDRDLDARAMLVVRWNIFNGGINRARILEARARAGEASNISANTQRIIERETRVSWNAMIGADARVPALRRQLQLSRATFATYSEQFDSGSRRLLDLLDAQSEIFIAESSMHTEMFVGQFNAFRVLAATGQLVHSLGLELPFEATEPHAKFILDGWGSNVHSRETDVVVQE